MKILVVEPDAAVRFLARHALEGFHHRALAADSVSAAGALLREQDPDAVVLASSVVGHSGAGVRQVMSLLAGGRSLPLLLLTEAEDAFANADVPTLEKPFGPEVFLARLEQTLIEQPEAQGWETGVITGNQLLEVLQDLETRQENGFVRVTGDRRNGLISLLRGHINAACYGLFEGTDAMLGMMQLPAAFYSFEAGEPEGDAAANAQELDLAELTLAMARLEGELARRGSILPAAGLPLRTARPQSTSERDNRIAPFAAVFERILCMPGVTLEDLLAQELAPPLKLRLALALLIHDGSVIAEVEHPAVSVS